jgi:hypothetical protein
LPLFQRFGTGQVPAWCVDVYGGESGVYSAVTLVVTEEVGLESADVSGVGGCYKPHRMDNLHTFVPKDESGFEWHKNPKDALRFKVGRDGDHLVTPFQCHHCHFHILTHRNSVEGKPKDALLMCCIIRANLDALWSREPSTIGGNRRGMEQLLQIWKQTGIKDHVLPPLGPHPTQDTFGMAAAVGMLVKSTQPGRHASKYTLFETLRKLHAAYSNYYHASVVSAETSMTLGRDTAKATLTTCPTQNMWFERFAKGCLKRMGQEVKQDLATSIHLMHALQSLLETEWEEKDERGRVDLAMIGAYILIAFAGSFRGHEVFLVDTYGLLKYAKDKHVERGEKFVIIPLLGKYKTENTEDYLGEGKTGYNSRSRLQPSPGKHPRGQMVGVGNIGQNSHGTTAKARRSKAGCSST